MSHRDLRFRPFAGTPSASFLLALVVFLTVATLAVVHSARALPAASDSEGKDTPKTERPAVQVHYLEIVTSDVDATCAALERAQGVSFGEPQAALGGSRTAVLGDGGRIGVRAPMHGGEAPVVRPYLRVGDIEAAVENAQEAGGQLAMPPTEIEGQGRFAIYFLGGNQFGLWQVDE